MLVALMEISNKTNRPLKVNLPGGKRLHLAPRGKAKITPKTAEFPAVLKMVEAGDVEILDGGRTKGSSSSGSGAAGGGVGGSQNTGGSGSIRKTGDR